MNDSGEPSGSVVASAVTATGGGQGAGNPAGGAGSPAGTTPGSPPGTADSGASGASGASSPPAGEPPAPVVTMPNYDPDPAQARTQVEQHLQVAARPSRPRSRTPRARCAKPGSRSRSDAASIDAAAMSRSPTTTRKLYDTAELVLDDLFKRESAKKNANVYYVYGLVYDHTNRPDQAVMSFKKAVEINPNHASALVNLGVHQLENSQYAEALARSSAW